MHLGWILSPTPLHPRLAGSRALSPPPSPQARRTYRGPLGQSARPPPCLPTPPPAEGIAMVFCVGPPPPRIFLPTLLHNPGESQLSGKKGMVLGVCSPPLPAPQPPPSVQPPPCGQKNAEGGHHTWGNPGSMGPLTLFGHTMAPRFVKGRLNGQSHSLF